MRVNSKQFRKIIQMNKIFSLAKTTFYCQLPNHPVAQDWLPTEAKYLDGRPEKTRLLLEKVLVRPAGSAHPVVCLGPNVPV